ncbi:SNAP25 ous protein [Ancistrocladus abbreviatus]
MRQISTFGKSCPSKEDHPHHLKLLKILRIEPFILLFSPENPLSIFLNFQGEKLLNSIGGMFTNHGSQRRPRILVVHYPHQMIHPKVRPKHKRKLGIAPAPKGKTAGKTPSAEPANAMEKVEVCFCVIISSENEIIWNVFTLIIWVHDILVALDISWRRQNKMMHFQI